MFERIREDIGCVFDRDPAARHALEIITCYPGVHAVLFYRLSNAMWRFGLKWATSLSCDTLLKRYLHWIFSRSTDHGFDQGN